MTKIECGWGKKTDAEGEECALWGAVSVSDVLEVSDGPSSDNNLAIHGRPNRFILTRRSACVCVRGEGWGGGGGGAVEPTLITHPVV